MHSARAYMQFGCPDRPDPHTKLTFMSRVHCSRCRSSHKDQRNNVPRAQTSHAA